MTRLSLSCVGDAFRGGPLLGFPSNAAQTFEPEGAPSFALSAKGGLLRSNVAVLLLLSWVSLLCVLSVLCDLCVPISVNSVLPSFFLFSFPLLSLRSSALSASLRYVPLSFNSQRSLSEPT
jgi:hypothetical protein